MAAVARPEGGAATGGVGRLKEAVWRTRVTNMLLLPPPSPTPAAVLVLLAPRTLLLPPPSALPGFVLGCVTNVAC